MSDQQNRDMQTGRTGFTRRRFLAGMAGLGAAGILGERSLQLLGNKKESGISALTVTGGIPHVATPGLPDPTTSGIEHVVVVMMENRSFDHFLGWLPGADGRQAGLTFTDRNGVSHPTFPLAPDYQGCAYNDPDHSYEGGRVEYNAGACDGWLRAGANDIFSVGYYTQPDLSFLGQQIPGWTTFDRYFSAVMAETYPNRFYQHAGQTDRLHNSSSISTLPTIWDRLAARGLTGRYYYSDVPFLALWGPKYLPISRPFATFLTDCAAGTLPSVSYIDPRFMDEGSGTSGDDHPHADIRNGEVFMNQIYSAVTTGPAWQNTVLVFNYDEWGGFYDHVAPPAAPIPAADHMAGNEDGLLGFRVPCMLVAPWARRGYISHEAFDHTSILRMIEWRWSLDPLSVRDATARNIADALDFAAPSLVAPQLPVPPGPFGGPCAPGVPVTGEDWEQVRQIAQANGWTIY